MNAWVLLLRGVNVGGHGKLPMSTLKALLATLGVRDIATWVQSGNAVFTGVIDARGFGALIEDEIQAHQGFRPRALVLSRDRFSEIATAYPWPEAWDDPTSGHIWFLGREPDTPNIDKLAKAAAPSERFAMTEGAFFLHAPDGIGQSKLAEQVERALGVPATARNLNTVAKLTGMLDALKEA